MMTPLTAQEKHRRKYYKWVCKNGQYSKMKPRKVQVRCYEQYKVGDIIDIETKATGQKVDVVVEQVNGYMVTTTIIDRDCSYWTRGYPTGYASWNRWVDWCSNQKHRAMERKGKRDELIRARQMIREIKEMRTWLRRYGKRVKLNIPSFKERKSTYRFIYEVVDEYYRIKGRVYDVNDRIKKLSKKSSGEQMFFASLALVDKG